MFWSVMVTLVLSRLDYGNTLLVSLLAYLNAAAQLVYHIRSVDLTTNTLISLHWLRVLQWTEYKFHTELHCDTWGRSLRAIRHYTLPALCACWCLPPSSQLPFTGLSHLLVPISGLLLPEETTSSQTLMTFCQHLKNWLFMKSYPDLIVCTTICFLFMSSWLLIFTPGALRS